ARRSRLSAFEVLLLGAAAYFSFHAKHDLWFVVLAAAALVASTPKSSEGETEHPAPRWTWAHLAAGTAALAGIIAVAAWKRDLSQQHQEEAIAADFPVAAAGFLEEHRYAGPLYHHFDWGGYLIWRLPQFPAAIDGRTNLHGDQRIQRFADTWEGRPGWDSDPDLTAAGVVLLQTRAPLAGLLRRDPRFEKVYEDAVAVVFVPRQLARGN